jgi:poly(3-hydroxybutyrate) depolymerase
VLLIKKNQNMVETQGGAMKLRITAILVVLFAAISAHAGIFKAVSYPVVHPVASSKAVGKATTKATTTMAKKTASTTKKVFY